MTGMILELRRMAWPADWAAEFGRQAPLIVEIGFGNGQFLVDQAQRRPEFNFLGIEIASPSISRTSSRIRNAGVENVRLVRADARSVLHLLCRPGTVQGVTIDFPDPWPKESHHHRRLISKPLLGLLASRMAPGADLDIATDHDGYANWIAEHLRACPYFDSRLETPFARQDIDRVRTKYEMKGLATGSACFYFKWRRNSLAAPDDYPLVEELPMPHVVVKCPLSIQEIAERFESRQCSEDQTTIRLIDLYVSQSRPSFIVETYVNEQNLDQRLMLEVYRRPDSDYLIRLQATGFPRATPGVHAAVACLARWVCGLHADASVLRHNLGASLSEEVLIEE